MQLPNNYTEEQRYQFEERAAICEYCGHASRPEAERLAYLEVFRCEPPMEHEQKEML